MPTYFFDLATTRGRIIDREGTELPDDASAREHARQVGCELMRHRESRTRSWRVDVTDSARRPCFELLFASVDNTINHLAPELRSSVETVCYQAASLADTIRAVRTSIIAAKATLARANGKPHLQAVPSASDMRSR